MIKIRKSLPNKSSWLLKPWWGRQSRPWACTPLAQLYPSLSGWVLMRMLKFCCQFTFSLPSPSSTLRTTLHHLLRDWSRQLQVKWKWKWLPEKWKWINQQSESYSEFARTVKINMPGKWKWNLICLHASLEYPVLIPSAIKLPIWGEKTITTTTPS